MYKHKTRRAVSTVMVAVAVILLAGCDAGIENLGPALAGLVGSAYATPRDTGADARFMAQAVAIEHRHFDIYNAYRHRFDSAAGTPQADATGGEGRDVQSGASGDERGRADTEMSCTMRALFANN